MNYLEMLASEIKKGVPSDLLPEGDTTILFLSYAVLLKAKGANVGPEDVHDAWTAWMIARGENHEAMVPYAELPASKQSQDQPFVDAIKFVAKRLESQTERGP